MLATQVILCVTIIGNAALLAIVLTERPSHIRTVFAVYVACIAAWAFTIYLNLFLRSLRVEDWIFAAAAGVLTAQFWFAKIFPGGKTPTRLREYWSLGIGFFFAAASFYPGALFTSITVHPSGYTTLDTGPLSAVYSLFALVYVCAPAIMFWRKYRTQERGPLRQQLLYISIGFTTFTAVAVLTNSILPVFFSIYAFNAVGPSFSLVFACAVFFVISKHEFLDIRRAIQRGITYSFLIAFVIVLYEVSLLSLERYFAHMRPLFGWEDDVVEPISAAIVTMVGVFTMPIIERYFQKVTDRFFFKGRYDYAVALESLSEILHESTDFDALIRRTQQSLSEILRASVTEIILYQDDARPDMWRRYDGAVRDRGMLFEPIRAGGKEIGGILVGEKRSGERYNLEDARLLRTFSIQASTAFGRAQLYLQVKRHALELEGKVAERTSQLREAREHERQMMVDIAHGLQTPFAVLRTKLEQHHTKRSAIDGGSAARSLTDLSDLITDLLKLARLEHDGELHFERCSLSEVVRDIAEEVTIIARTRGIKVSERIEPGIVCAIDVQEFRSAILNLLSNSMKYMRTDGTKQISIRLSREGSAAVLSIQDTGVGIPPADLPHIFDRFYRVRSTSETAGNGLGLSIAKNIVESHGGSLSAKSFVGEGTTMTVRLPLAAG